MEQAIPRGEAGFTYLAALFLVAILSILSLEAVQIWKTVEQREREQQLLFIGEQYRHAIEVYYQSTPGSVKKYPEKLDDLLLDKRQTQTSRPLRQLFIDPITNKNQWGAVMAPTGGIMGIFSLSTDMPVKQDGFVPAEATFKGAGQYQGWKFTYEPPVIKDVPK